MYIGYSELHRDTYLSHKHRTEQKKKKKNPPTNYISATHESQKVFRKKVHKNKSKQVFFLHPLRCNVHVHVHVHVLRVFIFIYRIAVKKIHLFPSSPHPPPPPPPPPQHSRSRTHKP